MAGASARSVIQPRPMICPRSRFEAPRARSDRTSRSSDTVGSPASIFATRDWLDCTALANWVCDNPRAWRLAFNPRASLSRSSMYADSWSDSSRKSSALPIFQPFASRRFLFSARIFVISQSVAASSDDVVRSLFRLLGEYSQDQDGVGVNAVHQPPGQPLIINTELVAAGRNGRHRARLRHGQLLALLQAPQ
jgi:hypothetical protein